MSNLEKDEKYSLRQRQRRTAKNHDAAVAAVTAPATTTSSSRSAKEKKKPKAAPLSKYRRKTANARERTRMREINTAFENLRDCVPASISCDTPTTANNEKLTKITTLRMAMQYIQKLSEVLHSPYSADTELLLSEMIASKVHSKTSIDSASDDSDNNNSMFHNYNEHPPVNTSTNSKTPKKRSPKKATPAKAATTAATKKRASRIAAGPAATKTTAKSKRGAKKVNAVNQFVPMAMEEITPATDFGLMLESDGESLHLSEPCMSPLPPTMKPFDCSLTTNGSFELGMFLESDNDSLEFSQPCLSPLGGFDVLSPFGELLHSGFTEQSSLDIYLTWPCP